MLATYSTPYFHNKISKCCIGDLMMKTEIYFGIYGISSAILCSIEKSNTYTGTVSVLDYWAFTEII